MEKKNIVFIAKSLDGYISNKDGGIEWLESVPNPDNLDYGWRDFMQNIDAIIMGSKTFKTVCSFNIDWPYDKPVFVLSNSLKTIKDEYKGKVELVNGSLENVLNEINQKGYNRLYIDGGKTIQGFLKEDLIDELIIFTFPILLGGGSTLFPELSKELMFEHLDTKVFLGEIVQSHYRRKR